MSECARALQVQAPRPTVSAGPGAGAMLAASSVRGLAQPDDLELVPHVSEPRFGHDFAKIGVHAPAGTRSCCAECGSSNNSPGGETAVADEPAGGAEPTDMDPCIARCKSDLDNCKRDQNECIAQWQSCLRGCQATCPNPGEERLITVDLVRFQDSDFSDKDPTGRSFGTRFAKAQSIWGKLGVTLMAGTADFVNDASMKRGDGLPDVGVLAKLHSQYKGSNVGAIFVDNPMTDFGGGNTKRSAGGPPVSIVLSDQGTSSTLLAHEMGHALGLGHPKDNRGDPNTIMEPSDDVNKDNPERNTMANFKLINWPSAGPTCLHPDP